MSWIVKKNLIDNVRSKEKDEILSLKASLTDITSKTKNLEKNYLEYLNLTAINTPNGEKIIIPNFLANKSDIKSFSSQFSLKTYLDRNNNRMEIYEQIRILESQVPDVKFAVQKYLSESYSSNNDLAFEVECSPKLRMTLNNIFEKFFLDIDLIIKSLIRFGDCGVLIIKETNCYFFQVLEPYYYEAVTNNSFNIPVGYRLTDQYFQEKGNLADEYKNRIFNVWEFVQFSVNKGSNLYGKGILEDLLFIGNRLVTTEELSAFFKASKFDKVVVSVPTPTDNPTLAFSQVQNYKESFKESLFGSTNMSGLNSTQAKIGGITDQIWMPKGEGFSLEKLTSDTFNDSMTDAEYYKNALRLGTFIPPSEFSAESTEGRNSKSLKLRNDIFRKFLKPIIKSTNQGLSCLCNIIGINEGNNPNKTENIVSAYLKGNDFIDQEFLDSNKERLEYISDLYGIVKNIIEGSGEDLGGFSRERSSIFDSLGERKTKLTPSSYGINDGEDPDRGITNEEEEEITTKNPLNEMEIKPSFDFENIDLGSFVDLCNYLKIDKNLIEKLLRMSKKDTTGLFDTNSSKELDINNTEQNLNKKPITGNIIVDQVIRGKINLSDLQNEVKVNEKFITDLNEFLSKI